MDRELYNELRQVKSQERVKSQESEGTKTNLCINKAHRPEFLNPQMGQKKYLESNF